MANHQFIEALHGEAAFQGFDVTKRLFRQRSRYQEIEILETSAYGRVLILDDIVQTTERDEFMYHEMLVHVPMFAHPNPREVLIVGGGDGGSLRELLKHDIDSVDMVEIDEQVVRACQEYLPSLNHAGAVYREAPVNLIINDAVEFLRETSRRYDVIICDSTDPIGPGEKLYCQEFYALCYARLIDGGVLAQQDGVIFFQADEVQQTMRALRQLGLHATCYLVAVPSYYGGSMSLAIASRDSTVVTPAYEEIAARFAQRPIETRHYSPAHHQASFGLPKWIDTLVK